MSVTPLDLQANMGHVHDVAKSTQAKAESIVDQHLFLDHESEESSNRQKDKIAANKESEHTQMQANKDGSGKGSGQKKHVKNNNLQTDDVKVEKERVHDPLLGNNVDYTR